MARHLLNHRGTLTAFVTAIMVFLSPLAVRADETRPAVLDDLNQDDSDADSYTLQPGDRVNIKIYPEDEYLKGAETEVSSEGNITLPLLGKVPVAGQTVIQAEQNLTRLIDKEYIVDPEVVIDVLKYKKQSVVILGQVVKPGTYEFPPGTTRVTLLQAVSMAGGFSDIANIKKIKIMRKGKKDKSDVIRANAEDIIGGEEEDVELESGDVVNVAESRF